mmetsp:Transcript_78884/g.142277  ORF Transcript_78884/g.142277 Transcript_78884/m.142277 type:complete len:446 (-) Transcript_78884:101-1438(-)
MARASRGSSRAGVLSAAVLVSGCALLSHAVSRAFVWSEAPSLHTVPRAHQQILSRTALPVPKSSDGAKVRESAWPPKPPEVKQEGGNYLHWEMNYDLGNSGDDTKVITRDVKVSDIRDLNELLRLPKPLAPTEEILLMAVTLDDGTRIDKPSVEDMKKLKPTSLRPVIFHWADTTRTQTRAPKQYDEIIQRLLNAGPADMEELVRSNWKMFDKGFYFRLTELKTDAQDERLREKIVNLENLTFDTIKAAQGQMRKSLPEHVKDTQDILQAMLEGDGQTLLWPPPAEAYERVAKVIESRATRAQYSDGWFETVLEACERFAKKMEVQQKNQLAMMTQLVMQRCITEWLRRDSLWEETDEGKFIYRLMSITHEQWLQQLFYEPKPLDSSKLRDELKIISETKVVSLPMGSKLQIYAAKYLQGMVEFVQKKDQLLEDYKAKIGTSPSR